MVAIALGFYHHTNLFQTPHSSKEIGISHCNQTYEHILQRDYVKTTHASHPTMRIQNNVIDYVPHNAMCVLT